MCSKNTFPGQNMSFLGRHYFTFSTMHVTETDVRHCEATEYIQNKAQSRRGYTSA